MHRWSLVVAGSNPTVSAARARGHLVFAGFWTSLVVFLVTLIA
jgi:hypothetical protein